MAIKLTRYPARGAVFIGVHLCSSTPVGRIEQESRNPWISVDWGVGLFST
jgi:hypothetical protein